MKHADVIIIGASASGLMCAMEAGKRGRSVLLLDQARKPGQKILMSGGGRCNFTNHDVGAEHYLSHNPHFCKSALSRYTQWDFIAMVQQHGIAYHERAHGQLFCDDSAKHILNMLLEECDQADAELRLKVEIENVQRLAGSGFQISSNAGSFSCDSLVIASGGLSIPSMGSSPFGYRLAQQLGIRVWPTSAGLVPFTLQPHDKERFSPLSGISVDSIVSNDRQHFRGNILFTHRGLSGPAILQISSWWQPGEAICIKLLPGMELAEELKQKQQQHPNMQLKSALAHWLPRRLVTALLDSTLADMPLQKITKSRFSEIAASFQQWQLRPNGTEGYRTAEVTLGGVDCDELSSKTFESNKVPGLYFIGEVIDVSGWLGGYNFQWAWSSGWCAGQYV